MEEKKVIGNVSKNQNGIKGDKGDAFKFADFSEEQLEKLRGRQGDQGIQGPEGQKGEAFKYEDFTEEQLESLRGPEGKQGEIGKTPSIVLHYDKETGDLYYTSDGILVEKEYMNSQNFITKSEFDALKEEIRVIANKIANTKVYITLYADRWVYNEELDIHYQAVAFPDGLVTEHSEIALKFNEVQASELYKKDMSFLPINNKGTVTVYCIGTDLPESNWDVQASVSEVVI